jgi:hypothetical protein
MGLRLRRSFIQFHTHEQTAHPAQRTVFNFSHSLVVDPNGTTPSASGGDTPKTPQSPLLCASSVQGNAPRCHGYTGQCTSPSVGRGGRGVQRVYVTGSTYSASGLDLVRTYGSKKVDLDPWRLHALCPVHGEYTGTLRRRAMSSRAARARSKPSTRARSPAATRRPRPACHAPCAPREPTTTSAAAANGGADTGSETTVRSACRAGQHAPAAQTRLTLTPMRACR